MKTNCHAVASRENIKSDKKEETSKMTQYLATEYRKGEILNMSAVLK